MLTIEAGYSLESRVVDRSTMLLEG
jgi:hypothetical protein